MAINTTTRQTTAFTSGNNFAFAFKVYEEGDVKVIRITTSTGAEEVLTITTHYTVTLHDDQNANPGGTVTLVNSGNPVNLGSGFNVVITSKVTPLQQTEITNQGGFFPEVINDVLDKAAILDQQQQSILDKTIRFPLTQTVGGLEITENAANRAGKVVQFDGSGDLAILATVDGRDVSADGAKLDTIETNAKDDQTAAEIRTLVESANDSNVFTDADHSKLNGIEAGATGDLNASEVKALYEGNSNTNAFTDALVSKLNGIEAGATGNQSASEIRTLVGSANDSNVFTDNDHSKLDGIETGATADQTSGDIKTLLQSDKLTHLELANDSVRVSQIQDSQITAAKLDPAAVITASEQASATPNDTSFLTSAAADARFFNVSTGDTIKDGDTFPDNDTTIATTAAINDRIIDLVDDVGGFVPIANETSFPTANPDAENGTGTVVSVKAASTDLTPSGTTVTIANGAGTGNTVTITGVPSVIPSGFGFIVETTTTLHTYTFHRLVPKATEVTTVAGKAVEIGRLGTADAVADMAILGTTDVVADLNMLATTDIVADMALLATTDVIADMALLAVTDVISDMNDLATSANITAMANCSNSISSINNASSNLNSINNFGDKYQVAANDPTTDGGGNSLAEGDLYFNTSANRLKVYDGSSWVNGVEISGSGAVTTGNTFTGDNRYNDNVKALFGTGSDLEIYHNGGSSYIDNSTGGIVIRNNVGGGTSAIQIQGKAGESSILVFPDGQIELYYNNSKKFETVPNGVTVTGSATFSQQKFKTSDGTTRGSIYADSNNNLYLLDGQDHQFMQMIQDGQVIIKHDNTNILRTYSTGVEILGALFATSVDLNDNQKILLGTGDDLEIYHDGTLSYIKNNTAKLVIRSDTFQFGTADGTHRYIDIPTDEQGVSLFYDDSKKFETTSTGVTVTGSLTATSNLYAGSLRFNDNQTAFFGTGNDLQIYHTGHHNIIDSNIGNLYIKHGTENMAAFIQDGPVTLYHDNIPTLVTDTNGIIVKGPEGDYGAIFLYADEGDDNADKWVMIALASGGFKLQNFTSGSWEDSIKADGNGSVTLYYDNSRKYETQEVGANFFGRSVDCQLRLKTSDGTTRGNIYAYNDNSIAFLNAAGSYSFRANNDKTVTFFNHGVPNADSSYDLGTNTVRWRNVYADTLYGQLGADLDTNDKLIKFNDAVAGNNYSGARFGDDDDLWIYHTPGNLSVIRQNTSGKTLTIQNAGGNTLVETLGEFRIQSWEGESIGKFVRNGGVLLYHNNNLRFEITDAGATLTGGLTLPDNEAVRFGAATGGDLKLYHDATNSIINNKTGNFKIGNSHSGGNIIFYSNNANRWHIDGNGHFLPDVSNSYDIGTTSNRVRNIYTNDLNLSNEGGANDVDGTWGSFTIQEGAEDLFLINKRNGKKYKFALTEVA